jgi:hypothetical protein
MVPISFIIVQYYNIAAERERYKTLHFQLHSYVIDSGGEWITFDNTISKVNLPIVRNRLANQAQREILCFMDFDIDVHVDMNRMAEKTFEEDVGLVFPVSTNQSTPVEGNEEFTEKKLMPCNMFFIRKSLFEDIGKFDESFKVAYADWDLLMRVMGLNKKILQHNRSQVYHYGYSKSNRDKKWIWENDRKRYLQIWGKMPNRLDI